MKKNLTEMKVDVRLCKKIGIVNLGVNKMKVLARQSCSGIRRVFSRAGRPSNCINRKIFSTGFTLIELLVVIAIISLLVSILMPSLNVARELAKNAVCASNLKGIGLNYAMYMNDEDGMIPPVMTNDSTGSSYWCCKLEISAGNLDSNQWVGYSWPTLSEVMRNHGIYKCPAGADSYSDGTPRYVHYGQNYYLPFGVDGEVDPVACWELGVRLEDCGSKEPNWLDSNGGEYSLNQLILAADCIEWLALGYAGGDDSYYDLAFRHPSDVANSLMCDLSVAPLDYYDGFAGISETDYLYFGINDGK